MRILKYKKYLMNARYQQHKIIKIMQIEIKTKIK